MENFQNSIQIGNISAILKLFKFQYILLFTPKNNIMEFELY